MLLFRARVWRARRAARGGGRRSFYGSRRPVAESLLAGPAEDGGGDDISEWDYGCGPPPPPVRARPCFPTASDLPSTWRAGPGRNR